MDIEKIKNTPEQKDDSKQETEIKDKVSKIGQIIGDICEILKNIPDNSTNP